MKKETREDLRVAMNLVFLVLLFIVVIALVSAIFTIVKYRDMLTQEPLSYVMNRYNMKACSCIDMEDEVWYSGEKGFKPNYVAAGFVFNNSKDFKLGDINGSG